MKLFDLAEKLEDSLGTWVVFQPAKDGEPAVEFLIRPVPVPEQRRIDNKYLGKQRKVTQTREGRVTITDTDKATSWFIEMAELALMDSRNAEFSILGDALAVKFSEALGRPVKSGDIVKLDGCWKNGVKGLVLELGPRLVGWVNEQAGKLGGIEAEEEQGKEETS